jgi:hypothetical protein
MPLNPNVVQTPCYYDSYAALNLLVFRTTTAMLNFLKAKKPELTITLDRPNGVYYPGETVGVTVEVQPGKDLKVQGAQVTLSGIEEYKYRTRRHSTDSDGNTSDDYSYAWKHNELFASEENFLGETTLPAGTPQRYSFQISLPAGALPSCAGEIVHVRWQVDVKLDRRLLGDLHTKADLSVHSLSPSLAAQPGEYRPSDNPSEVELAFILPGLKAVAGQLLNGQLRILPRKNFAGKLRVELVRRESVPYDRGNHSEKSFSAELAGKNEFTAEQQQTIPFQLPIPPDAAPSIQAPHGSITWVLKGVVDRQLRSDFTIEQNVEVYST